MQIDSIIGIWRTFKINFHGNRYALEHEWRQYQFGPGGHLVILHNYNGRLINASTVDFWAVEGDALVLYQYGKRHSFIRELTASSMLIEMLCGIRLYLQPFKT